MSRQLSVSVLAVALAFATSHVAWAQTNERIDRTSVSNKGSLLVFPTVELKWDVNGYLMQDTLLTIVNDYPEDVYVQFYLVNGDTPLDEVVGDNGEVLEPSHPGWNWADCQLLLTAEQPTYWSAATGLPAGCQPFTALDESAPAGRPDPESDTGGRVLRGYVLGWAVDVSGHEIRWNHLSGDAVTVNYANTTTWEYKPYAFQARRSEQGAWTDEVPGQLRLDGFEYDAAFDMLLFDFYAAGAQFATGNRSLVALDTDLTLMPASADLRQDGFGPVRTKAKFDIWNMNETRFSGTERCVTCWEQSLLTSYDEPNHFLRENLQTDVGKARIDGMASSRCDDSPYCEGQSAGNDGGICSQYVPLLGVAQRIMATGGTTCGHLAASGSTLVGMGTEPAYIYYDIISPPGEANDPGTRQSSGRPAAVQPKGGGIRGR